MLLYGDHWRQVVPAEQLATLNEVLRSLRRGRERHDELVRALIEAGELAQGLADGEFARSGKDDHTLLQATALNLVTAFARKVDGSWRSGFAAEGPPAGGELAALAALRLPGIVQCKIPEGYAYYGVYPEAFMLAARELAGAAPLVIGLRSIGVSLAAAVAVGSGASSVITLRPQGHPFQREVKVSDRLTRILTEHSGVFAVVDEGPGLSGSSFGAVGDLLEQLGVVPERIIFFPSHRGDPGPRAQARHRNRWHRARRLVKTLEDIAPPRTVAEWFEDVTGAVTQVEDLSHGGWLKDLPPDGRPATWAANERLKLRLTSPSGVYLAKFAGLGRDGPAKLARAQALHSAGFVAEPLAVKHGFLLERWLEGRLLFISARTRAATLRQLAEYLRFRSQNLPSETAGAGGDALREMALVNAEDLGGVELRLQIRRRLADLGNPEADLRPVHIDGRLHPWEWLQCPGGIIRKTDALDHASAHDLIGCQDIAWDLAGAAVEFGLTEAELRELEVTVSGRARPATLDLFECFYCAFQAGLWAMADEGAHAADRPAIEELREVYIARLGKWAARP
jgi:hypothetical protein